MRVRRLVQMSVGALAVSCALLALPGFAAAEPAPFGHACKAQNGVRFCPTAELKDRVPSFDKCPSTPT